MNPLLQGLMQAQPPNGGGEPASVASGAPALVDSRPSFTWSPLQEAVWSALTADQTPICVDAKAGAAKTTTLIHGAGLCVQPSIFLAFNKSIAEEIRGRLSKG